MSDPDPGKTTPDPKLCMKPNCVRHTQYPCVKYPWIKAPPPPQSTLPPLLPPARDATQVNNVYNPHFFYKAKLFL